MNENSFAGTLMLIFFLGIFPLLVVCGPLFAVVFGVVAGIQKYRGKSPFWWVLTAVICLVPMTMFMLIGLMR